MSARSSMNLENVMRALVTGACSDVVVDVEQGTASG